MSELLQEFVSCRGVNVAIDSQKGMLRGVKILGIKSRNGRTYQADALAKAVSLYEDAKVNVNHPKGGPLMPRDYQDRIGRIRNVTFRPREGLFADFQFNPKHPLAEQLLWDAEHAPENVGFSHNVQARTSGKNGQLVVEAITKVQSVDLVADPATSRGLFEAAATAAEATFEGLTLEQLRARRPDLVDEVRRECTGSQAELVEELDRFRAAEAARPRRRAALALLAEFGLPNPEAEDPWGRHIISEEFMQTLLATPDAPTMRKLVEARSRLVEGSRNWGAASGVSSGRPRSRDQRLVGLLAHEKSSGEASSETEFIRAIT